MLRTEVWYSCVDKAFYCRRVNPEVFNWISPQKFGALMKMMTECAEGGARKPGNVFAGYVETAFCWSREPTRGREWNELVVSARSTGLGPHDPERLKSRLLQVLIRFDIDMVEALQHEQD